MKSEIVTFSPVIFSKVAKFRGFGSVWNLILPRSLFVNASKLLTLALTVFALNTMQVYNKINITLFILITSRKSLWRNQNQTQCGADVLPEGRPYDHFIDGLNDKCLIKLINSPMKDKETNDEVIIELQKKLKELSNDELENTFWEIETGEFLNNDQIKELEQERDQMIKSLDLAGFLHTARSRNDQVIYRY